MSALPDLPQSDLDNDDSMLSRRFGKEILNYYAGSPLNRISFLRADAPFLHRAALAPSTRFLAFDNLNPLVQQGGTRLQEFKLEDVKPLVGGEPFKVSEEEAVKGWDSTKKMPLMVFLGLKGEGEGQGGEKIESTGHGAFEGTPIFAVDVTERKPYEEAAKKFREEHEKSGGSVQTNPRAMTLQADDAAMFAQARSILDWNSRYQFCAGCGHPNLSVHAGYKRVCPPTDLKGSSTPTTLPDCPSRKGITNITFPRTDPVMICAIVSSDGQKLLLGRQKSWPANMYSTLAGFLEPGESIEDCVRREAWEESGVRIGRVVVHSSQPWPYPSNLMIGAVAQTLPGEGEKVTLQDKELETARWFGFEEVREALETSAGPLHEAPPEGYREGALRVPPHMAIANRLMMAVVNGYLQGVPKM